LSRPAALQDQLLLKATEIVDSGGVKHHIFKPSDTEIWTVVGSEGEYLVSDDPPLCTCPAFYFALTRGRNRECHHLLALKLAKKRSHVAVVVGHDEEIPSFIGLLWGSDVPVAGSHINE
jgi:predicted nucleic acid-binding Zn finger protein